MSRAVLVAGVLLAGLRVGTAMAACDVPSLGPTDIPIGAVVDGRQAHIVTGVAGICDATANGFEVVLPPVHDRGRVVAQLALAGFSRRYGVRQMGFFVGKVQATAAPDGVKVDYVATVDGMERYQLAYTLYFSAAP